MPCSSRAYHCPVHLAGKQPTRVASEAAGQESRAAEARGAKKEERKLRGLTLPDLTHRRHLHTGFKRKGWLDWALNHV